MALFERVREVHALLSECDFARSFQAAREALVGGRAPSRLGFSSESLIAPDVGVRMVPIGSRT